MPILVARRIQYLTFLMAEELGFRCFYFNRQPILPHSDVPDEALTEVVTELGYDIVKTTAAYPKITEGFVRLPLVQSHKPRRSIRSRLASVSQRLWLGVTHPCSETTQSSVFRGST